MRCTARKAVCQDRPQIDLGVDLDRELTEGFAGRYIRRKARRLVGKAGITVSDQGDLEQDIVLALYLRLPRFDPERAAWHAFVATVVERQAVKILEARHTRKRIAGYRAVSLSAPFVGSDGRWTEIGGLLEQRHAWAINGRSSRDDFEQSDLRSDVSRVLAALPLQLRYLGLRLQSESVSEVGRRVQQSRATLYRAIARLRAAFEEAGLKHFLRIDRTPRAHFR